METKAIRKLEEQLSELQPGTIRYEAVSAAKQFKSSWVALGRVLWTIYKDKRFKEWGYITFDAYCAKEVGIRSATAKKLLHSYYFLEKEEPAILRGLTENPPSKLPSAESVNVLRLLSKQKGLPGQAYQDLRSQVFEKAKEAPEIRREVRMMLEEAEPDPAAARAERREKTIRRMIGTLKAMRTEMESDRLVPKKILDEIESLAKKIEQVL